MSSHREAPEISKDPVADSTDTYAFVSPNDPTKVVLITNSIPLQNPAGGPNFFEFGDDVSYKINVDNNGDGLPDVGYEFRFTTTVMNPDMFLYNTGPIAAINDPNFNRRQRFSLTRTTAAGTTNLGGGKQVPPCNIGPRSTPNYGKLARAGIHRLHDGRTVFAGQRLDGFYVDVGSVFDLLDLRPFQNLHLLPSAAAGGVDGLRSYNVHTLALEVPTSDLTVDGSVPTDPMSAKSVIGVWASASRQKALVRNPAGPDTSSGPWVQVSRLGNPLVNEALIPMGKKDYWNSLDPSTDSQFAQYVTKPELQGLIPALYPGVFPNLAAYTKPRADLAAILLTRHPERHHRRVPALHRPGPGRRTAAERGHPALVEPEQPGHPRWRSGRLPQRPKGHRRRVHHRAAGHRRRHHPAGRPDLHARRCRVGRDRRGEHAGQRVLQQVLPVPRRPEGRVRGGAAVMTTIDQHDHTHPHTHDHPDNQPHEHEHEAGQPPMGGPVVVDIGGDVGALIVRLDRSRLGGELHLRQATWHHTVHTGIWDRPLGDQLVTVAVYLALVEGTYEILDDTGSTVHRFTVDGGKVAETDLRSS